MTQPLALGRRVTAVEFTKTGIASTSYFLAIDLNNASGDYKHQSGSGIHISGATAVVSKDTALDDWILRAGVITDINGTRALVTFLAAGSASLRTSDVLRDVITVIGAPLALDLTVESGELAGMASNNSEEITAITTATNLEDVSSTPRPAEVGDLIIEVLKVSGDGLVSFDSVFWYWVE